MVRKSGKLSGVIGRRNFPCRLPTRFFGPIRWAFAAFLLLLACDARAADVEEGLKKLRAGKYADAIALAEKEIKLGERTEEWTLILGEALLAVGRYPEAYQLMTNTLARDRRSIRLRWLAREIYLANGRIAEANQVVTEIRSLVSGRPAAYRDPASLVVFGQAALLFGADPKDVLDKVFDAARKSEPVIREVFLARGNLALDKNDFALAAKAFEEGLKKFPGDPDLYHGLARAYAESERAAMITAVEDALKQNPRHAPSLLLLVDHRIDAEDYSGALKNLKEIDEVNPWNPEAQAYRAVIAHLQNDSDAEEKARAAALRYWTNNPSVDHLIGRKLSQKYRFAEGAALQRQALVSDPKFLPAKIQLANDLLRLGDESDGWQLASHVHDEDAYDVAAFNLVTLHDTMSRYETLTNEHFILRMPATEASIYGGRVLQLLEQAREKLTTKYGWELKEPTIVEIFGEAKDFGVRTFGMPDNPGYLGVCFGRVITANSPAGTTGQGVNWESVLWHEFCHVVTLQMTRNRMPRWLSEGISVYEERQANPAWGQAMNAKYREMILGGELTPIAKLSAAFLAPRSGFHLQFAYFESYLVVDFLVGKYGLEALKAILNDLRDGMDVNQALAKHTAPVNELETQFAAYARDQANALGPKLNWEKPNPEMFSTASAAARAEWAASHPTNFWALSEQARSLIEDKQWNEAKVPLKQLVELYPTQSGPNNAYRQLASAYRALGETNQERDILVQLATIDAGAPDVYSRLMEIDAGAGNWEEVSRNAERFLAVNPLVSLPYRHLAKANEKAGRTADAITACRTWMKLDPASPAEVHYELARLLHQSGDPEARLQTLMALEEAPRHRAALRLLLELADDGSRKEESKPTNP